MATVDLRSDEADEAIRMVPLAGGWAKIRIGLLGCARKSMLQAIQDCTAVYVGVHPQELVPCCMKNDSSLRDSGLRTDIENFRELYALTGRGTGV